MRALALLLLALPLLAQQELVKNGDFKKGLSGWYFGAFQGFKDRVSPKIQRVDGKPALVVKMPKPEGTGYVYVNQAIEVNADKSYRLSAECRATGTGKLALKLTQRHKPYLHCGGTKDFVPTEQWQRYVITFNPANLADNEPGVRLVFGNFEGTVWTRNISLVELPHREISQSGGKWEVFTADGKLVPVAQRPKPKPKPSTQTAQPKPPNAKSNSTGASALAAAFARDLASAKSAYQGTAIRVRGRVTDIEPALAGDTLMELDGGRVSILVAEGEINSDQDRFVKGELAKAKRQRNKDLYPKVELTGAIVGFRGGSVKMRHGKNVKFEKGD